jgi:hypothetical protein
VKDEPFTAVTQRIEGKKRQSRQAGALFGAIILSLPVVADAGNAAEIPARQTSVSIQGNAIHINGRPTYEDRTWHNHKIEGLLMNSRMVQGIFDDLNPDTAGRWAYPDTCKWDADRNTREILQFACDFARQFLDAKAADDDPIPMVLPETSHSVFRCFGVSVFRCFGGRWSVVGGRWSVVGVLGASRKHRPERTVSFALTETPRAQRNRNTETPALAHQLQALGIPHHL